MAPRVARWDGGAAPKSAPPFSPLLRVSVTIPFIAAAMAGAARRERAAGVGSSIAGIVWLTVSGAEVSSSGERASKQREPLVEPRAVDRPRHSESVRYAEEGPWRDEYPRGGSSAFDRWREISPARVDCEPE
jgi:hypothetical protein